MKRITFIITALCSLLLFGSLSLQAQTLTVSSGSGAPNGAVALALSVSNNTDGIAGAAFTITYDTDLTLDSITSPGTTPFFDTFSTMKVGTTVTVGTEIYSQAVVVNGAAVAAANAANKTGDHVLFELNFIVNSGATAGTKPVGIQATKIYNTNAGYTDPNGTAIPMLVGLSGTPETYPVRTVSVVAGAITVSVSTTDTDSDGIDDTWEITHFDNLATATATSDFDKDGYTDLIEYQNSLTDSSYDPKVINAPGGTGYVNNLPDSLILGFPEYGLYTYNTTSGFSQINGIDPTQTVTADIDNDGIDEVVSYFAGYGIYIFDNGTWSLLNTATPEAMIKFGNGIAIDFGTAYGLYTFISASGFTFINGTSPGIMTEADIDSDGIMELIAHFPSYGIYVFDNGTWNFLNAAAPEAIIKFGNGIAIDFGTAYGLYTFTSAGGFTFINGTSPDMMNEADIDSDGIMELIAHFPSYGIYIFDNGIWSLLNTAVPDMMLPVNLIEQAP